MISPTLILADTIVPPGDGKIYGIHTATQQWLKAYIRHARPPELRFSAPKPEQEQALNQLAAAAPLPMTLRKTQNMHEIPHCAVYTQLPSESHFWLRQWQSQKAFSICGLNHSLCGSHIYEQLRGIFLAPTEPWDALICASRASHAAINAYMDGWCDYLAARGAAAAGLRPPLRLPIIPMGTDTEHWAAKDATVKLGRDLRARLGIGKTDIVVLFLGRLNFSSKAHPFPMLQALQEAQKQCKAKLHLLMAGWFPSTDVEEVTRKLESDLAPDIGVHHLPASTDEERLSAYAAADMFVSLSDNIQESFGLTLVEAMACGLPVVASDWDGYRDTIAHGETGILVPTLMAPPGTGSDIGVAHGIGMRAYNRYLVDAAQATAVSAKATCDAVVKLANDAALRRRMGDAGRKRAAAQFDWRPIVKMHQALWEELEQIRKSAAPVVHKGRGPHYPDPFTLFRDFATGALRPDTPISLTEDWQKLLGIANGTILMRSPTDILLDERGQAALLNALQATPGIAAAKLLETINGGDRGLRTLLWLIKAGVTRPGGMDGF